MNINIGRGLLAVLVFTALVIAGPEWREDEDGGEDAGNTPGSAQSTSGTGAVAGLSGRLQALAPTPLEGGGSPDFDDVYIVCIDDPENFRATTADSGGFSEFDSRLYLFSLDGFGIVGNNTPTTVVSVESAGDGFDGAIIDSQATDATGSEVLTSGLYLLAITVAPRTPLGPNGEPVFFFETPDEISGPDGPDGDEPLIDWSTAFGACCDPEGACSLETEADCDDAGGIYQGDGITCSQTFCPVMSNDFCENAFTIDLGDTPFDTTAATTDGGADCKGFDALNDIWYRYEATSTGQLDVLTCGQTDYDSIVFVYEGCACPVGPGNLLSCGLQCDASVFVESGQCYTIRVGGTNDIPGYTGDGSGDSSGTGTLTLSLGAVGACFVDDGKYAFCFETTEDECLSLEGEYGGDGSTCPVFALGSGGAPAAPLPLTAAGSSGPGQVPTAMYPDGVPATALVGGDTPEPDGEYTIMVSGVCFANEVPTGACEYPDGTCADTTEYECVQVAGGTWLGEDVPCPDEVPPMLTCVAIPGNGNAIVVEFAAEDESGYVEVTAVIDAGCDVVPVESGQLIRLPWCAGNGNGGPNQLVEGATPTPVARLGGATSDVAPARSRTGTASGPPCVLYPGNAILIHSTTVTLEVSAVDAAGNESTCSIDLCAAVGGDVGD